MSRQKLLASSGHFLYSIPFFAVLIPFISGILLSQQFQNLPFSYLLILVFSILLLYTFSQGSTKNLLFALFILSFGFWIGHMHARFQARYNLVQVYNGAMASQNYPAFQGIITDLEIRNNGARAILELEYLYDNLGIAHRVKGGILVYLKQRYSIMEVGRRVVLASVLNPIKQFSYTFDYANYLAEKGIFLSTRLQKEADILWYSENKQNYIIPKLRNKIRSLIDLCLPWKESADFIKALFIGDRSKLEFELKQAYQVTGVMHVMAISGLHVGTLFLFFNYLLSWIFWPWRHRIEAKLIIATLLVSLLIVYGTFVLGGPSIFRSVLMFSCVAIAQIRGYRNNGNVLNTLFFSALLILCFQPQALHDIGFLLSYSAVLGLVILVPLLGKYVKKIPRILAKPMLILISSMVAQLATLPILLSVFTHFSTYFLFGNLLAIPLIGIIMPAIVIMLIFALIYLPLASMVGIAIHYLLGFLNKSILYLSSLPYAYIFTPHFGLWQGLLYYLVFGLLIGLWLSRARIYRIYLLYASILWVMSFINDKIKLASQHKLYLHKQGILEYIVSSKCFFFSLGQKEIKVDSSIILASKESHLIEEFHFAKISDYWYNSGVLLVNRPQDFQLSKALDLRLVILAYFSEPIFVELKDKINCREIVLLNSLKNKKLLLELSDYCKNHNIILHLANSYQLLGWQL